MAYENFKPLVWSAKIQMEMPKFTVFENECNYQFLGDVKKGRSVKIIGIGRPTIGDYTGESIGEPETVPDPVAGQNAVFSGPWWSWGEYKAVRNGYTI